MKSRRYRLFVWSSALLLPSISFAHPDHGDEGADQPSLMPIQTASVAMKSSVSITVDGDFRVIKSNGIPDHQPGEFPRRGNPNAIKPQSYEFRVPVKPQEADAPQQSHGFWWGVAVNGVPFEPGTGESWNNDMRSGWRYEAATGFLNLGLDEHNAHVQPNGAYHYHAMPNGLVKEKGGDEKNMVLVAWAADGYPVYTARAHEDPKDPKSALREMKSSYQLKKGERPSPPTGPGGAFDGRFTQDFVFEKGSGDLDECNGRFGVTPEFPEGTYYYCISAKFPFVARLWHGIPDKSFRKADRPGGPGGSGMQQPAPIGGQPRGIMEGPPLPGQPSAPRQGPRMPLIAAIDKNGDGELDETELSGAVQAMKSLDKNGDGKLTVDEYRGALPGRPGPGGPGPMGQ